MESVKNFWKELRITVVIALLKSFTPSLLTKKLMEDFYWGWKVSAGGGGLLEKKLVVNKNKIVQSVVQTAICVLLSHLHHSI